MSNEQCKNCKEEILKGDETKGTGNNIVHKKCKAIVSIKKPVEFRYTSYPSGLPRTYKEEWKVLISWCTPSDKVKKWKKLFYVSWVLY